MEEVSPMDITDLENDPMVGNTTGHILYLVACPKTDLFEVII